MNEIEWLGENNKIGIDVWRDKYQYQNETFEEWLNRITKGNEDLKQLIREKKFLFGGRALSNRGTDRNASMFNCYSSGYVEDNIKDIMQLNTNLALTYKAQGGQGISLSKIRPKGTPIGEDYVSDGIVPFMNLFNTTTATISQGGARKGALMMSIDIRHKEAPTFITIKTNADKITNANLSLEIDDEFMDAVKTYYETGETITLHESRMYENHKVEYDIVPIELYKLMVETVYDWGEPGCIFTNRFRNYNLMEKDEDYNIITSNPCGEQPLPKNFACNLGSLNLSEFVKNPYTRNAYFDRDEFIKAIIISVEALDDIIKENAEKHALKEQKQNSLNYRNMGLGVFGYANMLFKMGYKYGSEEAKSITYTIFRELLLCALTKSNSLAKEKGAFPKCKNETIIESEIFKNLISDYYSGWSERDYSLERNINKYGLRNCSLISVAPTGSIATMLGLSGGCEPEFSLLYYRRTINLKASYSILSNSVREYCELYQIPEYYEFERIKNEQSIIIEELSTHLIGEKEEIYELPENKPFLQEIGNCNGVIYEAFTKVKAKLPDYFVTSSEINWRDRVDTQAIMQKYVDTAISSTINLPMNISKEEVEQIYYYAWEQGLKGITLFRDGCKRLAILTSVKKEEKKTVESVEDIGKEGYHSIKWGTRLPVREDLIGFKTKVSNGCGAFHLELFCDMKGRPWETFISMSDGSGCERNLETISKLTSSLLRAGVPVEQVIETLKSTKPCVSFCKNPNTSKGRSCGSAIGFALENLLEKIKKTLNVVEVNEQVEEKEEQKVVEVQTPKALCPQCGAELVTEGACVVCKSCSYSKC